jgi:hypothetical protein
MDVMRSAEAVGSPALRYSVTRSENFRVGIAVAASFFASETHYVLMSERQNHALPSSVSAVIVL